MDRNEGGELGRGGPESQGRQQLLVNSLQAALLLPHRLRVLEEQEEEEEQEEQEEEEQEEQEGEEQEEQEDEEEE